MKKFYSKLLLAAFTLCTSVGFAQSDLILTGVLDGPLSGGTPKALEIYVVNDVADLSIYGLANANNGGDSPGAPVWSFPADPATAGDYIYLSSVDAEFTTYFEFAADYTGVGALSVNGDDVIELYQDGAVVDYIGEIGVDGSGTAWEYLDGWAYRVSATGPNTTFTTSEWTFSGINATDGETTNATAANPWPLGTYSTDPPAPTVVTIAEIQETTDVDGNSPLVNQMVITSGIVTGFYNSGFWIQDGAGAWTGIFVRTDDTPTVSIGDDVTVTASVQESNGLTRLNSVTDITVNSSANALPAPVALATGDAGVEDYESVLISVADATCTDNDLGFGEWQINDGSGNYVVDDVMYDAMPQNFVNYSITGIATYSFGAFKMLPRDADDVTVGDTEIGISLETDELMVSEADGTITVNVTITNPSAAATTVDVVVTGGSAVNGTNYTFTDPTMVTFPAGSSESQSFSFDIIDDAVANEDRTIVFALQNASNGALLGTSELEVTIDDDDTEIVITDIDVVAAVDADGVAVNNGTEFTVAGIVHGVNMNAAGLSFTIIDQTGGIGLYSNDPLDDYTVTEGDSVVVTGTVNQFNGLTQLTPTSIVLVSQGNDTMEPIIVTSFDESVESQVVTVECVYLLEPGQWTGTGSGFNVTITDGADLQLTVRIDNDVDLYSATAPTGTFNISGIVGQFDSNSPFLEGYQMFPRYAADIVAADCGIVQPPSNDNCISGVDVSDLMGGAIGEPQFSTVYTNVGATVEGDPASGYECFGEPDGSGSDPSLENTVWFEFTGDGNTYLIETNNCNGTAENYITDGDTQIAIYSGICAIATPEVCNEDGPNSTSTDYAAGAEISTVAGQTYLMMVDGYLGVEGEFCLSFTRQPLENDECDGAIDINSLFGGALNTPQTSTIYTNVGATSEGDPNPNDEVADCWFGTPLQAQTVWFSFTGDGETYVVETTDCSGTTNYMTDGDSQIAVFSGSCGDFTQVACNEDGPNTTTTYEASVEFPTEDGVEYYVMVDGYQDTQGEFCMQATMVDPTGLNDINTFEFDVFPNPAHDRFIVDAPKAIEAATLTNVIGQEVKAFQFTASQRVELNVSGLDAGIYILQLRTAENEISTAKVVVE